MVKDVSPYGVTTLPAFRVSKECGVSHLVIIRTRYVLGGEDLFINKNTSMV